MCYTCLCLCCALVTWRHHVTRGAGEKSIRDSILKMSQFCTRIGVAKWISYVPGVGANLRCKVGVKRGQKISHIRRQWGSSNFEGENETPPAIQSTMHSLHSAVHLRWHLMAIFVARIKWGHHWHFSVLTSEATCPSFLWRIPIINVKIASFFSQIVSDCFEFCN